MEIRLNNCGPLKKQSSSEANNQGMKH